jgi:hypothetical protein
VITVRKFGIALIGPPDLVRLGTAIEELGTIRRWFTP